MAVCHIIGNGPSAKYFNGWPGDIFGCNIPHFDLPYQATAAIDIEIPYWIKQTGYVPNYPILCPETVYDHVQQYDLPGSWLPVLQPSTNSGAALGAYLATQYDEIHLWGVDSLWSLDRINSVTDPHIRAFPRREPSAALLWRLKWAEDVVSKSNVICHVPRGAICETPLEGLAYLQTDLPDQEPALLDKPALIPKQEDEFEWVTEFLIEEDGVQFTVHYGDRHKVDIRKKELEMKRMGLEANYTT